MGAGAERSSMVCNTVVTPHPPDAAGLGADPALRAAEELNRKWMINCADVILPICPESDVKTPLLLSSDWPEDSSKHIMTIINHLGIKIVVKIKK